MRSISMLAQILTVSILTCAAVNSHADITKCVNRDGQVSYSSEGVGACDDAIVNFPVTPTAALPPVEAAPRTISRTALDNTVLRESAWAQAPAKLRRTTTDATTVKEAHANLQAIDRALSSMRIQKMASSR